MKPMFVTPVELADLFGVTTKTIMLWSREGVIVRAGRGRYDLGASVRGFSKYMRDRLAARATPVAASVGEERRRLLAAQADKAEFLNAAARGEWVRTAEVLGEWQAMFRVYRSRMLSVADRIGARCSLERPTVIAIDDEIRGFLTELADSGTWEIEVADGGPTPH